MTILVWICGRHGLEVKLVTGPKTSNIFFFESKNDYGK